jgi:hypothetical protein
MTQRSQRTQREKRRKDLFFFALFASSCALRRFDFAFLLTQQKPGKDGKDEQRQENCQGPQCPSGNRAAGGVLFVVGEGEGITHGRSIAQWRGLCRLHRVDGEHHHTEAD